jgi:hypothetical protein
MTRESLWSNAAPLAACGRRWVYAGNFRTGREIFGLPYIQPFRRGRINPFDDGPWQVRLREDRLPFADTLTSEFMSLIPRHIWQLSGGHSETIAFGDNGLRLWTVYESLINITNQYLEISDGRQSPNNRMKAFLRSVYSGFSSFDRPRQSNRDYTDITDDLDGWARVLQRQHYGAVVMFVPFRQGVAELSGVYACLRQVVSHPLPTAGDGAVVPYSNRRLPLCCLLEIGELNDGAYVPRDSMVIPGTSCTIDMGTGRLDLAAMSGTRLYCAAAYTSNVLPFPANTTMAPDSPSVVAVLDFPFANNDVDAQLCGQLFGEPAEWIVRGTSFGRHSTFAAPLAFNRTPFSSIGECPASEVLNYPDHARLVRLSHFGGAPTTPPYQQLSSPQLRALVPRSEEWGAWPHSVFPFTPHIDAIFTAEGPVRLGSLDPQRLTQVPIYGLRDYDDGGLQSVEPFPTRQVQAFTSCLESYSVAQCVTAYADNAPYLLEKPPANDMVIAGKRIKSVKVTLEPYTLDSIANVKVGIQSDLVEGPVSGFWLGSTQAIWPFDRSTDGWKDDPNRAGNNMYWVVTGTDFLEPPTNPTFAPGRTLYSGVAVVRFRIGQDSFLTQTIPAGPISSETEKAAVLYAQVRQQSPFNIGGENVPETVLGLYDPAAADAAPLTPLGPAPLTGSYTCERITFGAAPGAGNWFYYAGEGDWSCDEVVSHNAQMRSVTSTMAWSEPDNFGNAIPTETVDQFGHLVPITENWSLRADFVELHCQLEVMLQEAGTFSPDDTRLAFSQPSLGTDERAVIAGRHLVFDDPKGRLIDFVTHTEDNEPRPALVVTLHGRSVMRGTVSVTVDTNVFPIEYPWSLTDASSAKVASMAGGTDGRFIGDEWQTLDREPYSEQLHGLSSKSVMFNADQLSALLAGDVVVATRWSERGVDQSQPDVWQVDGVPLFNAPWRRYKISVKLNTEDV